ncbi:hypothetical protein MFRU_028g00770 [Monilinia fructicola]|uniref:Transcription factor CBF/NF-Y/archaeal histone domain-containing protein n=1 Tax=Monilinia fructicola TaxID=38448 RepID=A0A5M9JQT6_MONFR|nr:hypothetical protein EYC84_000418 [Monilinia fructicola]KAG4027655.1 hypothetical protein MFRU_028g00770 [Monilinia fructicola]
MPYSNSANAPRHEATGTTQLPLSRIKKIIGTDQDINMCSNNAAFVIALATEMFIQYLAESGHNVVKSERKPRRNIQYRDLSSAVSHIDNLEFLSDIVPRTIPVKIVKAKAHLASTLVPAKSTVPPTKPTHATAPPSNSHDAPPISHAGPSNSNPIPNSFSPPQDTAPPRVSVSGLLDSASSSPQVQAPAPAPAPAPNQIHQTQPQSQPSPNPQAHPNTIPIIHHTNGFTPANKPQTQHPRKRTSSGAGTGTSAEEEDPNAQLRMESRAKDGEDADEDVEMS